jgi:hypothetical protein
MRRSDLIAHYEKEVRERSPWRETAVLIIEILKAPLSRKEAYAALQQATNECGSEIESTIFTEAKDIIKKMTNEEWFNYHQNCKVGPL